MATRGNRLSSTEFVACDVVVVPTKRIPEFTREKIASHREAVWSMLAALGLSSCQIALVCRSSAKHEAHIRRHLGGLRKRNRGIREALRELAVETTR